MFNAGRWLPTGVSPDGYCPTLRSSSVRLFSSIQIFSQRASTLLVYEQQYARAVHVFSLILLDIDGDVPDTETFDARASRAVELARKAIR